MKFFEFLKILNCYIESSKSQHDFLYSLFKLVITPPYDEDEIEKDKNDEYYPFSRISDDSLARRICSGDRVIPKATARFIKSHFMTDVLINKIDDFDDQVKANLANDLSDKEIICNIDNIADVVAEILLKFVEAAIEEKDYIDVGLKSKSEIRIESGTVSNNDSLLLAEVNNKCPLCGKILIKQTKGNIKKSYKVTQIFPEDIDRERYLKFKKIMNVHGEYKSYRNLLAICSDCSTEYTSYVTEESFCNLVNIKKALSQSFEMKQSINEISLDNQIRTVLQKLVELTENTSLVPLEMKALKVKQKVSNPILLSKITEYVLRYYNYIEELLAEMDAIQTNTFNRIASEIRNVFEVISSAETSEDIIYHSIGEWIRDKMALGKEYTIAAEIVTAFFVQNCEVFHEISE